jgi:hypothetical protein
MKLWTIIIDFCQSTGVEEPSCPRLRMQPMRFQSGSQPHQHQSAMEYNHMQYYALLDMAVKQLDDRFDQHDFKKYDCLSANSVQ